MSATSVSLKHLPNTSSFMNVKGTQPRKPKISFNEIPNYIYYQKDEPVLSDVTPNPSPKREYCIFRINGHFTNAMVQLRDLRLVEVDHVHWCRVEGFVQVSNLAYEKSVTVRVSLDSWRAFVDYEAVYVQSIRGTTNDIFKFSFMIDTTLLDSPAKLELALRYQVRGQEFWDNNMGANHAYLLTWFEF